MQVFSRQREREADNEREINTVYYDGREEDPGETLVKPACVRRKVHRVGGSRPCCPAQSGPPLL